MENAAKALVIAGGILLAILIIGLLVILANSMMSYNETNANKELAKQLAEFNKQYESYNKKLLYGTDVITVVNKAIENNKKMDTISDTNSRYYVNVIIETDVEYKTTVKRDKITTKENENEDVSEDSTTINILKSQGITFQNKNVETNLGTWEEEDYLNMNKDVIKFFSQSTKNNTVIIDDYKYYIYSALTNFKSSIFKCNKIDYLDGRVHSMTFTEN